MTRPEAIVTALVVLMGGYAIPHRIAEIYRDGLTAPQPKEEPALVYEEDIARGVPPEDASDYVAFPETPTTTQPAEPAKESQQ